MANHFIPIPLLLLAGMMFASGGAEARIIPARVLERNSFCAREPVLCQAPVNRSRLSDKHGPGARSAADTPAR